MITRRDVDFELDPTTIPRDWAQGDAFETTFLAALSLVFPEGERFFVDSVKHYRDRIASPALAADVAGFVGQEAMHGREHRAFNELLVAHGYAEAPRIEARLRRFLDGVRRRAPKKSQLAITCALEHFTAMLAERLLTDARLRNRFDDRVLPLWTWHALEESEHKAVAFDVYTAVGGGYARRAAVMLVTTAVFLAAHAIIHARLMATRGILWKPWTWVKPIGRLWIWPGHFLRLVPAYLAYFRPSFHPNDRDTTRLVDDWSARMFGEARAA